MICDPLSCPIKNVKAPLKKSRCFNLHIIERQGLLMGRGIPQFVDIQVG